jgi:hypothetical protein
VWPPPDPAWSLDLPDPPIKDDPQHDPTHDDAPLAEGGRSAPADAEEGLDPPRDEEASEEEGHVADVDAASPEAIARRVAALGDDDETDRFAREEEVKLAERQRKQKKKKKGGLEAAATKKLAKIGAKAAVRRSVATAVEADPLIERAVKFSDWAKKNQAAVAIAAGVAVLAGLGVGVYAYVEKRHETQASIDLAKAMGDEHGRIGDPDKDDDDDHPHDPRPIFKTTEDRRETALREYRDVASRFKGTGAGILARLAEGSILLDKHDVAGAMSAFDEVKDSPLAKADAEVHGRALEGLGFAYELKAEVEQGDAARGSLDEAGKAYRELENTDVLGFEELGLYHQARVLEKQGDRAKAIELLKKLHERLDKPGDTTHSFVYLEQVADDRLRALDPTAIPPKAAGGGTGPGGKFTQAQIRKLMEQMKHGQQPAPGGGGPSTPGGPGAPPMPPEDLPR